MIPIISDLRRHHHHRRHLVRASTTTRRATTHDHSSRARRSLRACRTGRALPCTRARACRACAHPPRRRVATAPRTGPVLPRLTEPAFHVCV